MSDKIDDKPTILIVDDDLDLLGAMRASLRRERRRWSLHFMGSAAEAVSFVDEMGCDVIVSDMRMAEMNGAQLLERMRDTHPGSIRIVLSGQSNEDLVHAAVPAAHQWLSKPCDRDVLVETIERSLSMLEMLPGRALRAAVGSTHQLPISDRAFQTLSEGLNWNTLGNDELVELADSEPCFTARLLQFSGSSYFGTPQESFDSQVAVSMLGPQTLRRLLGEACILVPQRDSAVGSSGLGEFERRSLLVSRIAEQIAPSECRADARLAGLLHEIGRLVLMSHFPGAYAEVDRAASADHSTRVHLEYETFGATHAEIGAALLGIWGAPTSIVEAVALHHNFEPYHDLELDAVLTVHVAQHLAELVEPRGEPIDTELSDELNEHFASRMNAWRDQALRVAQQLSPSSATDTP